jgi:CelD/BcsL family acetyltransferase involved in cellulose biosynthesis
VEELRPLWERLQNGCLTSDIDHFLTYMQHAPGAVRPHVLLVEDGGLSTLVVARLEDGRLAARLGYKTLFSTRMRTLTVAYGGVLGHLDERRARVMLQALAGSLDPGDADVVRLRGLDVAGSLHATATGEASWLRRERPAHALVHWRSALPGTLEEFLAPRKKKVRWQARKDPASLGETYGDALEVRVFRRPSELHRLFRDSEVVHRKTYQSALGVGFSTGDLHRRLTELAMARGWFRGYVLYLGGQPVAFWHGNAYHGTFGLGATGYDPAYAGDRPGGFLLMRLIEDLCADDAIHTLDFGFGDATYKRQLGDESRLEEDVAVFAPTAKAVAVNLARTTLHSATGVARRALARSGRLARAKKRWRGQLAGGDEG